MELQKAGEGDSLIATLEAMLATNPADMNSKLALGNAHLDLVFICYYPCTDDEYEVNVMLTL